MPSKPPRTAGRWTRCRQAMRTWQTDDFLTLIGELYKLSPDNRRFLEARLIPPDVADVAADVKAVLKKRLSVDAVWRDGLSHAEIKRVIDGFAKAVGDPAAVADVLVTDIGLSCRTFAEVGDFERIVDHVYRTMKRLGDLLLTLDPAERSPLIERLYAVADRWNGKFGYGLSDELWGMALYWKEKTAGDG